METSSTAAPDLRVSSPFGEYVVDPRDVVAFPSGVPGFETCRRFVLLSSPSFAPMQLLQSVEGPAASFLVIDPRLVLPQFRAVVGHTDLARLGATETTVLLWLSLVSFDSSGQAYANLRAPIVINPERMLGYQVMPHNSLYPMRHPLASE
ncbi:MAG: flagellar assembly protein FliW [Acidobacteria bacterium]|nr:flagellar assembly protein FliW [Acidobacteriota bacterium]